MLLFTIQTYDSSTNLSYTFSLTDKPLTIRADPLFKPETVKINLTKNIATVGEMIHVEVQLNNGLERVSLFVFRVKVLLIVIFSNLLNLLYRL